jgi:transcription termination factor Rho
MRHGPRHPRRHRHPHRHDRPNGPHSQQQGPRGPRDPRQAPIPTTGPTIPVSGVVDLTEGAGGFLRQAAQNYLPSRDDVVVPAPIARDYGLRDGTEIEGLARDGGGGRRTLVEVTKASGLSPEEYRGLPHFQDLISVNPHEAFHLAAEQAEISLRVIDLIAPIGRGQRGLIVSPPKAGKTTLLEHLGQAIAKHHPEVHLILLLIDERPEEVTHFRRAVKAEVLASSADSASDSHIRLARLAMERAKRLVEAGRHVVILLDSLTRLGRASNREMGPGGRTMSGGVDNRALQFPRQFFGAARNCEGTGSLTILATALVDTGSRMDEVIFQEFKGTGNMELILDRAIAERRIFPAVDVLKSGTRREELLCTPEELKQRYLLRRALADLSTVEAAQFLIDKIQKTPSNTGFLSTLAAPAPARRFR